jgi:hypothetical protein
LCARAEAKDNVARINWAVAQVAQHLFPAVDWVMIANDHTFIVADNLLCYLATLPPREARFVGHRLRLDPNIVFNSGTW